MNFNMYVVWGFDIGLVQLYSRTLGFMVDKMSLGTALVLCIHIGLSSTQLASSVCH